MTQPTSTPSTRSVSLSSLLLTATALVAFAANSVLCRLALSDVDGPSAIDATSFTLVRLLSGALMLLAILRWRGRGGGTAAPTPVTPSASAAGSWLAAAFLFGYAICFSLAYNDLTTATGALILFGFVQLTMLLTTLLRGHRLSPREGGGMVLAFAGLVYLLLPGLDAPPLVGFVLMALAGIAWGGYTLKGRGSSDPLADTTFNFSRSLAFTLVLLPWIVLDGHLSGSGTLLAVTSGALASGIGYSIWYHALRDLSATQAGVVQLSVPVIAALGGVVLVAEPLSWRLVIASSLILGGIGLTLVKRQVQRA